MQKMNDMDYVKIYAKKLREDNMLFVQHKKLVDSQINSSRSLFKRMFGEEFNKKAREYLRKIKNENKN